MRRRIPLLAFALCALAPTAVSSEPDPKDAAKYRHELFETLGANMMDLALITKGKAGQPSDMLGHAIVMHETAKIVTHAFPAGTGSDVVPTSRALPVIWTDGAAFEAAAQRLVDETATLVKVAKKKDVAAVGAQLSKLGAACGDCHERYRGPEPEGHGE